MATGSQHFCSQDLVRGHWPGSPRLPGDQATVAVQVSTGGNSDSEGQSGSPTFFTQILRGQAEQSTLMRAVVFGCGTVTSGTSNPGEMTRIPDQPETPGPDCGKGWLRFAGCTQCHSRPVQGTGARHLYGRCLRFKHPLQICTAVNCYSQVTSPCPRGHPGTV